jgi:predicted RNA binding protein YcfA (HicA-like mRNA interferase family)
MGKLATLKEVQAVVRYAETLGYRLIRRTGTGHLQLRHTSGRTVTMPSTPSNYRWKKNAESQLRRTAKQAEEDAT